MINILIADYIALRLHQKYLALKNYFFLFLQDTVVKNLAVLAETFQILEDTNILLHPRFYTKSIVCKIILILLSFARHG